MKRIITIPQKCDMGSGQGVYEFEESTILKEFLDYFKNNSKNWGTFTIRMPSGEILRKFDYNLHRNDIFYYNISGWQLKYKLKEITFEYCFMNEDVEIYLKK